MDEDREPNVVVYVVVLIVGLFAAGFALWCNIIAFTGGVLPILGLELKGGVVTGLLWLFLANPIIMFLGSALGKMILMPLAMATSVVRDDGDDEDGEWSDYDDDELVDSSTDIDQDDWGVPEEPHDDRNHW